MSSFPQIIHGGRKSDEEDPVHNASSRNRDMGASLFHNVQDSPERLAIRSGRRRLDKHINIDNDVDYEDWIDMYLKNVDTFRSSAIYYTSIREELLELSEKAQRVEPLPNQYILAVACDLQLKLADTNRFDDTFERNQQRQLIMDLIKCIYVDENIEERIERDGLRGLLELTPYFSVVQGMNKEVVEKVKEEAKYKGELNLIEDMNERTTRVLDRAIESWQKLFLRAILRHWRNKTALSAKQQQYKTRLADYYFKLQKRMMKRRIFEEWVHCTHKVIRLKSLAHVDKLEDATEKEADDLAELEAILEEEEEILAELTRKKNALDTSRMNFEQDLENLMIKHRSHMEDDRRAAEDAVAVMRTNISGMVEEESMREMLQFTEISFETIESIAKEYKMKGNPYERADRVLQYLRMTAEDNKCIFRYYSMSTGIDERDEKGQRKLSEKEFYSFLDDTNIMSMAEKEKGVLTAVDEALAAKIDQEFTTDDVITIFKTVGIEHDQFFQGEIELSPKLFIEVLVRVAVEKYVMAPGDEDGDGDFDAEDLPHSMLYCLKRLCEEDIYPFAHRSDAGWFRQNVFQSLEMQDLIWDNRIALQQIFRYYASAEEIVERRLAEHKRLSAQILGKDTKTNEFDSIFDEETKQLKAKLDEGKRLTNEGLFILNDDNDGGFQTKCEDDLQEAENRVTNRNHFNESMNVDEFTLLLHDCTMLQKGGNFTHSDVKSVFLNVQHSTDGSGKAEEGDLEVNFLEFIEALVAVACYSSPNPYEPIWLKLKQFLRHHVLKKARRVRNSDDLSPENASLLALFENDETNDGVEEETPEKLIFETNKSLDEDGVKGDIFETSDESDN
eukprot:g5154.t1